MMALRFLEKLSSVPAMVINYSALRQDGGRNIRGTYKIRRESSLRLRQNAGGTDACVNTLTVCGLR